MSALRQVPIIHGQTFPAYKLVNAPFEMPPECEFGQLIDSLPSVMTRKPSSEYSPEPAEHSDELTEEFEPINEPLHLWLECQADGYEAWQGPRSKWLASRLRRAARFARFRSINDIRELEKQLDFQF